MPQIRSSKSSKLKNSSSIRYRNSRSISGDLIIILALVMILATILVTIINYVFVSNREKENLEQKADNYLEYLVESIELSLWALNEEHILKIAEAYYNNELVASLRITEIYNNTALFDREKSDEKNLIVRSSDVIHKGKVIGHVTISLTPRLYEKQIRQMLRTNLITALVIILTMIGMTSLFLRLLLGKSLKLLIEGTEAIAEGNYQISESDHKYSEFDSVLEKFQMMSLKVQNREESLRQVNMQLEKEIQERKSVEKSLRSSEERLQSIINNMGSLLYLKNTKGEYILINKRFEDVYGIPREKMVGLNDYAIFSKETADLLRSNDKSVLDNNKAMKFEEVTNKNGELKIYLSIKFPLYDTNGDIVAVCGLSTDITEHKKNEQRISDALEFNEKIISESPIGIGIYHESGVCITSNSALARMIGTTKSQLMELNFFDNTVWNNTDLINLAQKALFNEEKKRMELKTVSNFGTALALDCYIVPFYSEGKHHILFMAVDIRKRINAEEESNRLRVFLKNIIDSMPSSIVGADNEGYVTLWNLKAQIQTGLRADAALGKKLVDVYPMLSKEKERIQTAMNERRTIEAPRLVVNDESGKRYYDMVIYPLVTNGLDGVVVRIDDVSDRVRLEDLMIQSEKMMSIGGLAAGMAHEINNPLAAILQNVQLMRNRLSVGIPKNLVSAEKFGLSVEAIENYMTDRGIFNMIESVLSAGKRASKIVENMLSFSRKADAQFQQYDLSDLLDRTVELAENDYDLKKKYDFRRIEIIRDYDPNLPFVHCEGSQIQQVFLNILKNGAQAMGDARTSDDEPSKFFLSTWQEDDMICVSICDNGPGMDENIRKRVFEPFFTTKQVGVGTGLGLSLSYFIITKNHNGHLSVDSTPDRGTRFVIRLPINYEPSDFETYHSSDPQI